MNSDLNKTVLTIAGSDPSGGAGIQADIKTFTTIGVYCGAVITAITCQNTMGVKYFSPLSPGLVKDQIESVLADLNISHIKIGMIGSPEIAEELIKILSTFEGEIVFDPVMAAGSGDLLYKDRKTTNQVNFLEEIVGLATVITPNLDELGKLSNVESSTSEQSCQAAKAMLNGFPNLRAICLTGGHIEENQDRVTDFLIRRTSGKSEPEVISSSHPRIKTVNLHGTGCTFSSAFTAYHLLSDEDDRQAFTKASEYTAGLIEKSATTRLGQGNGPLLHYLA